MKLKLSFFILFYTIFASANADMNLTCSQNAVLLFELIDKLKSFNAAIENQIEQTSKAISNLEESINNIILQNTQGPDSTQKESLNSQLISIEQQLNNAMNMLQRINPQTLSLEMTSLPLNIRTDYNNSSLLVSKPNTQIWCVLEKGDHNIWFDKYGNLWGYDRCSRIFRIIDNKREVINSSECCKLFN